MNSEEAIRVIEVICQKLGIAVNSISEIVPELAKYKIALDAFWSITSVIIVVISMTLIKKSIESASKEIREGKSRFKNEIWDFWTVWTASIIGGICILVFSISFLIETSEMIGWIISPEASAIAYVVSIMR